MANTDNLSNSTVPDDGISQGTVASAGGRRYVRKKDQKRRGSTQSGDSLSTPVKETQGDSGMQQSHKEDQSDADIQRIKLNRLNDYEVDNLKMVNVFGNTPDTQTQISSSMRLNPLYDQNGTVVVSGDQAQSAKLGDSNQDMASQESKSKATRGKKGTYKRPKKTAEDEEDEEDEEAPQEQKINYSKNFRFGKRATDNGVAGKKKLTSFGVVMPSRVKQNTLPKTQPASAGGTSQYALEAGQSDKSKADLEAARRRHEIRRRWRYVTILILIILVVGLLLTVVLFFATNSNRLQ